MSSMQAISQTTLDAPPREASAKELAITIGVAAAAALLFGLLFNRESTLSYSIGYNLYGAERILDGETPYRDFHTLYPPATLYLNALLFKWFGTGLYIALAGVMVAKVLTVGAIYIAAREVMPRAWALTAAAYSLVWLRPNGPFKAVPMHYGALFLALGLYLLLRYVRKNRAGYLLGAGVMFGLLALFKHNIGAYAIAGSLAMIFAEKRFRADDTEVDSLFKRVVSLLLGLALPLAPVAVYMQLQGALVPMLKTLLFGPGEFLLSRLAATPRPWFPLLLVAVGSGLSYAAFKFRNRQQLAVVLWAVLFVVGAYVVNNTDQSIVDTLIFYAPVMVIVAALALLIVKTGWWSGDRMILLTVTVAAAAAFMEAFPRFAREQAVAAMPFVAALLLYLLLGFAPALFARMGDHRQAKLAIMLLPFVLYLMGGRLFFNTYFGEGTALKSNHELAIERGRGVYFPEARGKEIEDVVGFIQSRVPEGGYFFAQSYAGSSFLFLADRNNPSGAQFWGGVGVSDQDRAETLAALEQRGVQFIVTGDRDLAAEKYQPMRDYIETNFNLRHDFGEVVILERGSQR